MTSTLRRIKDAGRRPDIETELADRYHVAYEYVSGVDPEDFDYDKSLANQARFEALDEDTVEQYREAVDRGDPFPAVIAYRPRKNMKLLIIDGNHRLAAHKLANKPIDVYEVATGTRGPTIALMTFSFNTRHGRPTSEEERVMQALYLLDNGATIPVAASTVNIPERVVRRAVAKQSADKRAVDVGADRREWDALGQSSKSRLLNISTDEGFKDAIHLAYAAGLGSEEIFELVALLNGSKSAVKQRSIVKNQYAVFSERIQDSGGGVLNQNKDRKGINPKARMAMALGQLMVLPEDISQITRAYIGEERTTTAKTLMEVSKRLALIATSLDASVK